MWPNEHLNACYHREQLAFMARRLGDPSAGSEPALSSPKGQALRGKRILDVGCGTGRIARALAERGAEVVGIDFAPRVIEIARAQSPAGNPSYRVESIFNLAEDGQYDMIVSWGSVAIACRDRAALHDALTRLRRALRPGGELLLLEPIHRGFLHRVLDLDTAGFCVELERVGFQVRSVDQLHFWPARLALAFVPWPRALTRFGYRVGQWLMGRLPRAFEGGDYKGIYAVAVPVDSALVAGAPADGARA